MLSIGVRVVVVHTALTQLRRVSCAITIESGEALLSTDHRHRV